MRYKQPFVIYCRRHPSGNKVYYCRIRSAGRIVTFSTGLTSKTKAFAWAMEAYRAGKLEIIPEGVTETFGTYAKPWWNPATCAYTKSAALQGTPLSTNYLENMKTILKTHVLPEFKDIPLGKITTAMIETWQIQLFEKGKGSTTVDRARQVIDRMLKEAVRLGKIEKNPCDNVKRIRVVVKEKGTLSKDEISLLWGGFKPFWKDNRIAYTASLLSVVTGMRLGEIAALRWESVDLEKGLVEVKASLERSGKVKTTKAGYARWATIPSVAIQALSLLPCREGFVFSMDTNGEKPYKPESLAQAFERILDRAGIDRKERNISFHSLRHTANTFLKAGGAPESVIRSMVGHKSVAISNRYTHIQSEHMDPVREAQERIFLIS